MGPVTLRSPTRWARPVSGQRPAPALRLFCFPYAGAGASAYQGWRLPDELAAEVWAIQPPGRENRRDEPVTDDLDRLVAVCGAHLTPLLDRPFAFFGHSLGALAAFELTRLLRRRGGPRPVHLFLSAHRAPDLPPSRPPVSRLPDGQFLARLWRMAAPSPSVVRDPELLLLLAPMMRADFRLCEGYAYTSDAPVDQPVTCFAAVDDPEVDEDEVAAWERHTTGGYRLSRYTGGHLFVRDHAPRLLAEIAADLVVTAAGRGR
jgi:surfactin synthase thioesterase subunit